MYVHHRTPARVRRPSSARRVNALRSRMRQIKPTGYAGPWRDVPSARLARRGCSSGGGSRASWRGDDCSVGRCASRNPPRLRTMVSSTSMATESMERNAATSRLTRPTAQARATHGRIATVTPVWRARTLLAWSARGQKAPVQARLLSLLACLPPADLNCPHDVDNYVENESSQEGRCR